MKNLLYYGDNLDVLRRHVADESIELVYRHVQAGTEGHGEGYRTTAHFWER